jgi:hypothetical protein
MRILIALHKVMDLGGIINHTEQLIGGLKDLGHQVDFKELIYSDRANGQNKQGDWIIGPSGVPHDQGKGWNFKRSDRIAYRGPGNLNSAKQILSKYDLIIWTVPVPSKNKDNIGNHIWPELYNLPPSVKQIAFSHDGNSEQGYPYILRIAEHLTGLACVHHCAFNGAAHIPVPRALILNPQHNPVRSDILGWQHRRPGFVNMQTFKAWKHAHELIEAIAYMPEKLELEFRHVAGQGIEYRYMVSEDKCKENYIHGISDNWFSGMKFWDAAVGHGMIHDGYWNVDEVGKMLSQARCLVDPSWSNKYSKKGGHYNRVVVDAMIHGAIPAARSAGMGNELFKAGEHYVEIPEGCGPKQYADTVLSVGDMSTTEARPYREAALDVLPRFDRTFVARQIVELASSGDIDVTLGSPSQSVEKKSDDILFNHFGIL